jgi:hypothetical protein
LAPEHNWICPLQVAFGRFAEQLADGLGNLKLLLRTGQLFPVAAIVACMVIGDARVMTGALAASEALLVFGVNRYCDVEGAAAG